MSLFQLCHELADTEARKLLDQLCGGDMVTLKTMPKDDRKLIVRKAIGSGINMRQPARITGIEYRSIYLVINPKQKTKNKKQLKSQKNYIKRTVPLFIEQEKIKRQMNRARQRKDFNGENHANRDKHKKRR